MCVLGSQFCVHHQSGGLRLVANRPPFFLCGVAAFATQDMSQGKTFITEQRAPGLSPSVSEASLDAHVDVLVGEVDPGSPEGLLIQAVRDGKSDAVRKIWAAHDLDVQDLTSRGMHLLHLAASQGAQARLSSTCARAPGPACVCIVCAPGVGWFAILTNS